jgi:hypothetical protein
VYATIGQAVRLPLFANRNGVAISYQWIVVTRPIGSTASIVAPKGFATLSRDWSYAYPDGSVATFIPDIMGTYSLQLSARLVFSDRVYPTQNAAAPATLQLQAAGAR